MHLSTACFKCTETLGMPSFQGSMVMDHSTRFVDATMYATLTTTPQTGHHCHQTNIPPATTIISAMPTHRTPVAYKRPLAATTPRQMIGTSSVVYSPRATPPAKIMAGQGQQRVVTKMVSSIQTKD